MVFGFNKKKSDVVDFRNLNSTGIPSSGYLKRKSAGSSSDSNVSVLASSSSSASSTNDNSGASSSGGGFFSFFGGSDSSSNAGSSSSYGSSNSSSEVTKENFDKVENRLNDLLYRFSRLMDRVELLEKKMDRFERKNSSS